MSANKAASVKVPELLDYVTLQFSLERIEVEEAAKDFFSRVGGPIKQVLEQAGMTMADVDQVEIIGGGVRVPKVAEMLNVALEGKNQSTHLNGDEAMCFGSAFIASNSSSAFKVKQVFLTQNLKNDIHIKISPLNESDALTEDEQRAEGLEDEEIVKYN